MIKIFFQPQPAYWPERGGVREHLIQLYTQLEQANVQLVKNSREADILHVESAYPVPGVIDQVGNYAPHPKKVVYVCHGGFVPQALPVVIDNLQRADIIVSVAGWLLDKFFAPHWKKKTVIIPNGINPEDFKQLPDNNLEPGFVLYAKEWQYSFNEFFQLAVKRPDLQFVTTVWPPIDKVLPNVKYIGLRSREEIKSVLSKAGCLLLTGSEVCPTMLLEAWYLKVPVVAKAVDGAKELMSPKFELNLYTDDLTPKIDFALANRGTIGSRGKAEVQQKYLWPDLIKKYLEVYERVMEE